MKPSGVQAPSEYAVARGTVHFCGRGVYCCVYAEIPPKAPRALHLSRTPNVEHFAVIILTMADEYTAEYIAMSSVWRTVRTNARVI